MKEQLNQFLKHLHSERGLSERTRSAYERDISHAITFFDSEGLTDLSRVTEHHVRALVAHRHRQGLGGKSLQRMLSSIRGFFKWLLREGKTQQNPAVAVRAPKAQGIYPVPSTRIPLASY